MVIAMVLRRGNMWDSKWVSMIGDNVMVLQRGVESALWRVVLMDTV
jgi:hypothetical protein